MNPEEDTEVGTLNTESTENNDEGGKRAGNPTSDFVPGAANNADTATAKSNPPLTQFKRQEKDLNMKWDKAFHDKCANSSTFFKQLFIEAGPDPEAMEGMVTMITHRIEIYQRSRHGTRPHEMRHQPRRVHLP